MASIFSVLNIGVVRMEAASINPCQANVHQSFKEEIRDDYYCL